MADVVHVRLDQGLPDLEPHVPVVLESWLPDDTLWKAVGKYAGHPLLVVLPGADLDLKVALYEAGVYDVLGWQDVAEGALDEAVATTVAAWRADAKRERRLSSMERTHDAWRRQMHQFGHDVRDPLAGARMAIELAERRLEDRLRGGERRLLDAAKEALSSIEAYTDQVRAIARLDAQGPRVATLSLSAPLQQARDLLGGRIAACDAVVEADSLPEAAFDPDLMAIVFQNLLGNSLKYRSKRRPRITVDASQDGGTWCVRVRDNGRGMAPVDQASAFEAGTRGEDRHDVPGEGLGLATCRRIIEAHGGQMTCQAVRGEGTTVSFTLPATVAKKATDPVALAA